VTKGRVHNFAVVRFRGKENLLDSIITSMLTLLFITCRPFFELTLNKQTNKQINKIKEIKEIK